MLQAFAQNVSSILRMCCKRFDLDVAYVFTHILQCSKMFHLFQSSVAASIFMLQVASVLYGCCICFHTYIASVCSKCVTCFRRVLQVFYLDVAYVVVVIHIYCKRMF